MKFKLLFLFTWFAICGLVAQPPGPHPRGGEPPFSERPECRKHMHKEKVAFINRQVNFTDAEAKLFWPIYDEYRKQMDDSRLILMTVRRAPMNNEQEYQNALDIINSEIAKQEQYSRDFYNKLVTFLSPSKIYNYFEAEEKYKRHLVKQIEGRLDKK